MGWLAFSRFGGIFLFQVGSILIPSWRVKLLLIFRLVVHDSQGSFFDVNGLSWCCMDWCTVFVCMFLLCCALLPCMFVSQTGDACRGGLCVAGRGGGGECTAVFLDDSMPKPKSIFWLTCLWCAVLCVFAIFAGDAYHGGVCGDRGHCIPAGARPSRLRLFMSSRRTGGFVWCVWLVWFVWLVCFVWFVWFLRFVWFVGFVWFVVFVWFAGFVGFVGFVWIVWIA